MVLLLGGGGVNWMMENQRGKEKQEEEQGDKAKWDEAKK